MSKIKILLKILCERTYLDKKASADKEVFRRDISLVIESEQCFMDTEKFFQSVKGSLEKYFDKIEVK